MLMNNLFCFCFLSAIIHPSLSWYNSVVKLPQAKDAISIGYNDNSSTIYVFGGSTASVSTTSDIYKWNMSDGSFSFQTLIAQTPIPMASYFQNSVTVGDYVYVAIQNTTHTQLLSGIYIFDMNSESFINKSIPYPPRDCLDGCFTSNTTHLFLIGGQFCGFLQIYNIETQTWISSDTPSNVSGAWYAQFCTVADDTLYVMGGYDSDIPEVENWVFKYFFSSDSWQYFGEMLIPSRSGWTVYSKTLNRIYNVGGYDYPNMGTISVFDVGLQKFIGYDTMLTAVTRAPALIAGDTLMIFGGEGYGNSNYYSSIQMSGIPLNLTM